MIDKEELGIILERDMAHIGNSLARVEFLLQLNHYAQDNVTQRKSEEVISQEERKIIELFALLRGLKFVGESLESDPKRQEKISSTFTEKYPFVPWNNIVQLRHRLTHNYPFLFHPEFSVDIFTSIANEQAKEDLLQLKSHLEKIFSEEATPNQSQLLTANNIKTNTPSQSATKKGASEAWYFTETIGRLQQDYKLDQKLNCLDLLKVADLEIENLKNLLSINSEYQLKNEGFLYALENCIENIIQIIKDICNDDVIKNSEIPKNKISKVPLFLRIEVNKSSSDSLKLFFTRITQVRKNIAHVSAIPKDINELLETARYLQELKPCIINFSESFNSSFGVGLTSKWDWGDVNTVSFSLVGPSMVAKNVGVGDNELLPIKKQREIDEIEEGDESEAVNATTLKNTLG